MRPGGPAVVRTHARRARGSTAAECEAGARMAYLRIYVGETLLEQRELTAPLTRIGRAPDNDVVLNGRGVSKHHASIERSGDAYVLVDNGSANGVFVAGRRIERHPLNYWDEIQIFNFVLKFMAAPRLRGEEAGAGDAPPGPTQEETMELDISSLGDLAKLRRRIRVPVVTLEDGSGRRHTLDKVNFTIGRGPECDLHAGGWWAPRVAASIQRRHDGCYLLPGRRGRVSVNGHRVWRAVLLAEGDHLRVRGLHLSFGLQPIAGH